MFMNVRHKFNGNLELQCQIYSLHTQGCHTVKHVNISNFANCIYEVSGLNSSHFIGHPELDYSLFLISSGKYHESNLKEAIITSFHVVIYHH
jgi:hypothetical protein